MSENTLYTEYYKQQQEIALLKQNVAQLQEQLQKALIRISELREKINRDCSSS